MNDSERHYLDVPMHEKPGFDCRCRICHENFYGPLNADVCFDCWEAGNHQDENDDPTKN